MEICEQLCPLHEGLLVTVVAGAEPMKLNFVWPVEK